MGAHRRTWALALLATILGCSSSGDTASAPPPSTTPTGTSAAEAPVPVGGLVATIGTNRLYAPDRGFGLGLQNVGDEPVLVRGVQLESELFAPATRSQQEVLLPPGSRRLVLPVPYGEARCDGDADPSFSAVLLVDDGRELRVPAAEDHPGAIGRLHGRECAAADVHERAEIRFGDHWSRDGIAITGELLMEQRRPGAPVVIDDAVGNVIFTLRVDGDPPILRVTDEEPRGSVPVTISADRCDPHAVSEFKRPFVFLSWIAVGQGRPVPVELELTGGARTAVEELLATCMR